MFSSLEDTCDLLAQNFYAIGATFLFHNDK